MEALQHIKCEVDVVSAMNGSRHRTNMYLDRIATGYYRLFWADIPVSRHRNVDTRRRNEHWALIAAAVSACNHSRTPACVGGFRGGSWNHPTARDLSVKHNMVETKHRLCAFDMYLKPALDGQKPSLVSYCLYHNSLPIPNTSCNCGTDVEHRHEHM